MSFSFLDEDVPDDEGIIQQGARHGARELSNIGTRAIGLPGDVFSLINDFISRPATEFITGKKGLPYEETFLGKAIPTTEQHRKGIEKISGDYLKPRNNVERWADDVIEDAAIIINPGQLVRGGAKAVSHVFKNLAKSTGANLAGETVKQQADSEAAGITTKAGSLFLLSLLDQKSAAKQVAELYQQAEKNLPSNAKTNAKRLQLDLQNLEKSVSKGRPLENLAPSEKFIVDSVNKVRNLIKNGQISVEQAWAQKRSLNEELSKLYQVTASKKDQQRARKLATQINKSLNDTIHDYGKTNPEFLKPFKNADQAFGTIAQSNWIGNWVEKNLRHSPVTSGLLHLLSGPVGSTIGGLAAPYQALKLTYRIYKSPTLAKIYGNTIKSAAKEDVVAFNKYLKELDERLQEEEGEEYWEFQD